MTKTNHVAMVFNQPRKFMRQLYGSFLLLKTKSLDSTKIIMLTIWRPIIRLLVCRNVGERWADSIRCGAEIQREPQDPWFQ